MDIRIILLYWLSCVNGGLVFPEDLTNSLNLIYGFLPPILKGTNSTIGFGYSLGEHADFQIVFELGPRRQTNATTYATNERTKRNRETFKKSIASEQNETAGSRYLNKWAQSLKENALKSTEKPPKDNRRLTNIYDYLRRMIATNKDIIVSKKTEDQ